MENVGQKNFDFLALEEMILRLFARRRNQIELSSDGIRFLIEIEGIFPTVFDSTDHNFHRRPARRSPVKTQIVVDHLGEGSNDF